MVSVTFRRTASTPAKLIVEPWANEYLLSPGDVAVVTLQGSPPAELEVDEKDGVVVVYGWSGCVGYGVTINGIAHSAVASDD